MDILINLCLVFVIVVLFMFISFSKNPYIFVAIVILSLSGFLISLNDPLYLTVGWNNTLTYDGGGNVIGSIGAPIKETFEVYNYVFELVYLMSMVGGALYWSLFRELTQEDKEN